MGTLAGCAPMACLGAQITADVEKSWALWLAEPPWPAWVLRLQLMWRGHELSGWLSPNGPKDRKDGFCDHGMA